MLIVRYNTVTGFLTGWDKNPEVDLPLREGEGLVSLDIDMPDSDDYENYLYVGGILVPSGKTNTMSVRAELDAIWAAIDKLKEGEQ